MSFLVWDNEQDAQDSLTAVNAVYGCPFEAENGYKMDQWDFVKESNPAFVLKYGFFKPEDRLGKEVDDLMAGVTSGFTEHDEMPEEFIPENDE